MKVLKQLFIMMFMVAGLSLTAMAQKDKPQDRPPKPNPPKVEPGKPSKPDEKPKKPSMSFFVMAKAEDVITAE